MAVQCTAIGSLGITFSKTGSPAGRAELHYAYWSQCNVAVFPRSLTINSASPRYCLHCDYQLIASEKGTCPECGKAFDPADVSTFATSVRRRVSRHHLVGAALLIGLVLWTAASVGFGYLIDLVAATYLVGFLAATLWFSFGPMAVFRAVRVALTRPGIHVDRQSLAMADLVFTRSYRLAWAGGVLVTVLTIMQMLRNLSDPRLIGQGVAFASQGILFGGIIAELIVAPLHIAICKRRAMLDK